MCINILEGDNSPRVKDTGIQDVTQHMQTLNIHVSPADLVEWTDGRTRWVRYYAQSMAIVRRYHCFSYKFEQWC